MQRLVCLDGLRGVLAVYVMLSHTLPFAPFPAWLLWLFQHGGAAVDVFFMLSGLVIVQSLDSHRYQPLPFLIARAARIYPVFLAVFAFAVAVQPIATSFEQLAWIGADSGARYLWAGGWPADWGVGIATHLTMTHGIFPNGVLPHVWVSFLGTAWSLSTEWQFYLLALLLGERLGFRRLSALFLALAGAAIVWQAMLPEAWQFSRAFLPNKAHYFALGVATAVVMRDGQRALNFFLVVLAITLALCWAHGGANKLLPPLVWTVCVAAQALAASRLATPVGQRLPRSVTGPLGWTAAALQSRSLVWLGALSYCIYLVHEPVQRLLGLVLASLMQGNAALFAILWIPGSILLPLVASWWLHTQIEQPGLRWGRALARRSAPSRETARPGFLRQL